eukprot:scaffold90180_cov75-Phaeocystis_antarctica.AAC.3
MRVADATDTVLTEHGLVHQVVAARSQVRVSLCGKVPVSAEARVSPRCHRHPIVLLKPRRHVVCVEDLEPMCSRESGLGLRALERHRRPGIALWCVCYGGGASRLTVSGLPDEADAGRAGSPPSQGRPFVFIERGAIGY